MIKGDDLKITPLKAVSPEEAAAEWLYAMAPRARGTRTLPDAHSWTGLASAFTHPHT